MKIFLDGVEYKAYREIMKSFGVKYGCLNYEYLWLRMPKFNISDCEFLDELMVYPGELYGRALEDYEDFLNENAEYITFALSAKPIISDVKILPLNYGREYYISFEDVVRPFGRIKYMKAHEAGDYIHGFGIDYPFLDSMNTGIWMKGRAGIASYYRNDKMRIEPVNAMAYIVSSARRLIKEGYKINLLKVKKHDWKEVAKVNCINWIKYQEKNE